MKNVTPSQLRKCIFVPALDFTDIVEEIFDYDDIDVEYTSAGFNISRCDDWVQMNELCEALEKYFDVKRITSVHTDHCEWTGVWIIYED